MGYGSGSIGIRKDRNHHRIISDESAQEHHFNHSSLPPQHQLQSSPFNRHLDHHLASNHSHSSLNNTIYQLQPTIAPLYLTNTNPKPRQTARLLVASHSRRRAVITRYAKYMNKRASRRQLMPEEHSAEGRVEVRLCR